MAVRRLLRLRTALASRRNDGRSSARRDRNVRVPVRLHVAIGAQKDRIRPCKRIGTLRRDACRRHWLGDLLQRGLRHPQRNPPLSCQPGAHPTLAQRKGGSEIGCSVFGGHRRRATAETEVETGAHDALGFFDIEESPPQPRYFRRETNLAGAKIVKAIFDEAGKEVGKGIFTAETDGPSRPRLTRRISSPEYDRCRPIIIALPGATALEVAEEA